MGTYTLTRGKALQTLRSVPPDAYNGCLTGAPCELGFMGKKWDSTGIAFDAEFWGGVYTQPATFSAPILEINFCKSFVLIQLETINVKYQPKPFEIEAQNHTDRSFGLVFISIRLILRGSEGFT